MLTIFICVFLFASAFGQTTLSSTPSCSNSNFLLTPALRGQILDYVNDARNTLKNGQLLLYNNKYALIPETMPELSWSCEVEEEMHEYAEEVCNTQVYTGTNFTFAMLGGGITHSETVNSALGVYNNVDGRAATYLSQHTIYTGTSSQPNTISVLHDKAENIGCAIYECLINNNQNQYNAPSSYNMNFLFCKVTPEVQFGEKVYEVSSSANANFPSQDVICPQTQFMNIEIRQMVLEKINAVRQKIQDHSYILENGDKALKAANMPNLIWDCDEEAALLTTATFYSCVTPGNSDPETVFEMFIPSTPMNTLKDGIAEALDQVFDQNPNLNFLSQSTTYSPKYPPALALSDQATFIACSVKYTCYDPALPFTYTFACRAIPSAQLNSQLYQV